MREIKFRVWNKKLKLLSELWDLFYGVDGTCMYSCYVNGKQYSWYPEEVELMQYTGLKDKNGKEIYEGDIVWGGKFNKNNGKKEVAIVKQFMIDDCDRDGIHRTGTGTLLHWGGYKFDYPNKSDWINFITIEIIGNIYENTELLKDN